MTVQFLIRLELLLLGLAAHFRLSESLVGYFGRRAASSSSHDPPSSSAISCYYLLVTACQFHIPFYSSRLLPNTFALLFVIHAYSEWFDDRPRRAAALLVFATATFRCDVLILLFTVGLTMLVRGQLSVVEAFVTGVLTGVVSLTLTVPLDSLLWGRLTWPEFEVWWFNAIENRSGEWGTMPIHWYLSSALPKGLLLAGPLIPLAFVRLPEAIVARLREGVEGRRTQGLSDRRNGDIVDSSLLPFFGPVCGFVALYSFLPHKEMRFMFPALPMFNVCAAYGMCRLHKLALSVEPDGQRSDRNKRRVDLWAARGMYLCGIGAIAFSLLGSLIFVKLSRENYPGGVALERLRHHLDAQITAQPSLESGRSHTQKWEDVNLHIDVAAAMTGVSLFGQRHASHRKLDVHLNEGPFCMEKSGYEEENSGKGTSLVFTHLLTEHKEVKGYHVIDVVPGHPRLDVRRFQIDTSDAIYILERNGWGKR